MKKTITLLTGIAIFIATSCPAVGGVWSLQGDGTIENPYEIRTAEDFITIAREISESNTGYGEYFVMTQDIDFNGSEENPVQLPSIAKDGIVTVANVTWGFEGNFDGGNFTVSGIYHTENANDRNGQFNALFSSVGSNAVIKNLNFGEDNYVSTYNYAGSIASLSAGVITGCHNSADITASNAFAGGICGQMIRGTGEISNCENNGYVSAMTYAAGIVAGTQSGGSITEYGYMVDNCVNNGNIFTSNALGGAGIAGSFSGTLTGCENNGDIDGTAKDSGQYNAGVIATASYLIELSNCVNNGSVSGSKNIAGIIAMIMKGDEGEIDINGCENNGRVVASGENISGIVANTQRAEGLVYVSNCKNNAEVSTTADTDLIGNLRGNWGIALGEGNVIAAGLTIYVLDDLGNNSGVLAFAEECGNTLKDGKYMIDGVLYIVKDRKVYSVAGQLVK